MIKDEVGEVGRRCIIYTLRGHGENFGFYSKPLEGFKLKSDMIKFMF